MAIDVAQIDSLATVCIGSPPRNPLYEGDTLEAVFVFAEGFDPNGVPINPAPFFTDSGGWGAEIVMDADSTLAPTVDTPLADDGKAIVRLALGESTGKAGKHEGVLRAFNPIGARTQQRVLFTFTMVITEGKP